MLSLCSVPAVYFPVCWAHRATGGRPTYGAGRTINRRKFTVAELQALLRSSRTGGSGTNIGSRLALRMEQPAFHPDTDQAVLRLPVRR